MPVTVVFRFFAPIPTISTSWFLVTTPRSAFQEELAFGDTFESDCSTLPVQTVPRPAIENVSNGALNLCNPRSCLPDLRWVTRKACRDHEEELPATRRKQR